MNEEVQTNPSVWLSEHEDLWTNEGDHIEFRCPIEEVPQNVIECVEAYKQEIANSHEQAKILKAMGLSKKPQHEGPAPVRPWQNRR